MIDTDTPEVKAFLAEADRLMKTFDPGSWAELELGRRYIRVWTEGRLRSVYCFLDRTNGDILKAATYKAPAPNSKRGNIYVEGWKDCIDWHGTKYLR